MSNVSTRVTFKGLDHSAAVEARVHEWVAKLTHVCGEILHCDVVVETPHRHHRQGRLFHVRIDLGLPGRTISVSHDPGADGAHDDVYVAVRDSFLAARRQLSVD